MENKKETSTSESSQSSSSSVESSSVQAKNPPIEKPPIEKPQADNSVKNDVPLPTPPKIDRQVVITIQVIPARFRKL